MFDKFTIGKKISSFQSSPEFDGYSRVRLKVSDVVSYTAGTDTGRTLECECPWGTQQMANDILEEIRGWQYQPYEAEGAIIDPSMELSDGVTVNGVYSGVYSYELSIDQLCRATLNAPSDEEVNHEYPYVDSQNKQTERKFVKISSDIAAVQENVEELESSFGSELAIQAQEISAKVTKIGGNNSSFGWSLTDNGFLLYSGNNPVFKANPSGVEIIGKITAKEGYIGNGSSGFEIGSTYIRNSKPSFSDVANDGVYIGVDGISLGQGKFRVDRYGNLVATSGSFSGEIQATTGKIGGFTVGGDYLQGGALTLRNDGSISGNGWSISANGVSSFSNISASGSFSGGMSGSFSGVGYLGTNSTIGGSNIATYIQNLVAQTIRAGMGDIGFLGVYSLNVTGGMSLGNYSFSRALRTYLSGTVDGSLSVITGVNMIKNRLGYVTNITVNRSTLQYVKSCNYATMYFWTYSQNPYI